MFSIFPYLTTLNMKPGEVLMFDNRTFHASPPNTSSEIRLAAGVGITQRDAQLIHYNLKPDGTNKTLLKYNIDPDFYLKYENATLANMFDKKELIEGYELVGEAGYDFPEYSADELIQMIKDAGNEFNVPMCEKLSKLFGYNMDGTAKQPETTNDSSSENEIAHVLDKAMAEAEEEEKKSFFEVYTPINVLKEIKFRLTGK
jgi:hypothetical protein